MSESSHSMIQKNAPTIRRYHRGKILFREGQESRIAFMIKSGTVDIYKMHDNKKTVLASLGKGDIFGEMAILANEKRSANAVATSFCELVILTEDIMSRLLDSSPVTIKKMVELLAQRVIRADLNSDAQGSGSPFLALAKILDLAYKDHLYTSPRERRNNRDFDLGLPVETFATTVRSLAVYSRLEIDLFLDTISRLRLIEVVNRNSKEAFAERYIKIPDPEGFIESVGKLYQEMKEVGGAVECRMKFVSIPEFAGSMGCSTETFLKKVIKEEVPENLFFFNLEKALEWSRDKDSRFFRKVYRPKKALESLDSADDLIFIDNPTLKKAFENMNYHKVSVLYNAADEANRKKISKNVSRKLARILTEEKQKGEVDEMELHEVVDELLDRVRKLKKT